MPTKVNQNVTVRAGETRAWQITVRDEDGTLVDLQNDLLVFRIAKHGRMTPPHYIVDLDETSSQITLIDAGGSVFAIVQYDPALEDLVLPGKHRLELRVTKSGSDSRVVTEGVLTILDSISNSR